MIFARRSRLIGPAGNQQLKRWQSGCQFPAGYFLATKYGPVPLAVITVSESHLWWIVWAKDFASRVHRWKAWITGKVWWERFRSFRMLFRVSMLTPCIALHCMVKETHNISTPCQNSMQHDHNHLKNIAPGFANFLSCAGIKKLVRNLDRSITSSVWVCDSQSSFKTGHKKSHVDGPLDWLGC